MEKLKASPRLAVRYHRVSTDAQVESGLGLETQREETADWCRRKKATIVGTFEDQGLSGKNTKRPELQKALAMLASGEANTLVVSKLDRLSRSVVDFANMMHRADKESWDLVIEDMDIDTKSDAGRMIVTILSALSEWERRIISRRTKASLAVLKSQGVKLGRPEMSPILKERILTMRMAGNTLQHICDVLNAEAIPTPHGGNGWQTSTVRKITADVKVPRKRTAKPK